VTQQPCSPRSTCRMRIWITCHMLIMLCLRPERDLEWMLTSSICWHSCKQLMHGLWQITIKSSVYFQYAAVDQETWLMTGLEAGMEAGLNCTYSADILEMQDRHVRYAHTFWNPGWGTRCNCIHILETMTDTFSKIWYDTCRILLLGFKQTAFSLYRRGSTLHVWTQVLMLIDGFVQGTEWLMLQLRT